MNLAWQLSDISENNVQARLNALESVMLSDPAAAEHELKYLLTQTVLHHLPTQETLALCLLGGCAFYQGHYHETTSHMQAALKLSRQHGLPHLEARSLSALGLVSQRLDQFDQALDYLTQSLTLAEQRGDDLGRCRAMNNLAVLHNLTSNHADAVRLSQQSRHLALGLNNKVIACDAGASELEGLYYLGQYDQVIALAHELLPILTQEQLYRYECVLRMFYAMTLQQLGRTQEALQVALDGFQVAEQTHDPESICITHITLGRVYLQLGQTSQAKDHLLRAVQIGQEGRPRLIQNDIYAVLSEVLEAEGNYREALHYARTYYRHERASQEQEGDQRAEIIAAQANMEVLRREAEMERLRNVELAEVNRALRETQSALAYQATHDAMTGLLNRAHFYDCVQQALNERTNHQLLALLFIDLDQFKEVNDSAGHYIGDLVLQEVAKRFQRAVGPGDLVGRLGGDEFSILIRHVQHPSEVEGIASSLLRALHAPLTVNGQSFHLTASIGITIAPEDGQTVEDLQKHADLAMYYAKWGGRDASMRFNPEMSIVERERRDLERDLREAVQSGQLSVNYQGLHNLPAGELAGFETLVRWVHPQQGRISPERFIGLAEQSLLILDLGRWVMRQACQQAARWNLAARGLFTSVNVSAVQFEQPDFVEGVRDILQETDLPGQALVLELTESMLLRDTNLTTRHIGQLQELGVQVALDDFGTGYSSLSILQTLPFVHLKIDRSFIHALTNHDQTSQRAELMISVMVQLGHSLNMSVVAEGVENEEQKDLLTKLGCDKVQGFLLSRPQPPDIASQLLN